MPLCVCATPIGNLEDVTLRVLRELSEADVVLCEDTRHTRILLDRHGIRARSLLSLHQHNEAARSAELVPRLLGGERAALVSDAGLPGVNDPGGRLVAAAIAAGVEVTVLPGASAVATAVVVSGLAGDGYRFLGWLPRREAELRRLWVELDRTPTVAVAFESPRRLPASLASLAAHDPGRTVAVCRELTKLHEEIARGTAAALAEQFAEPPRGEVSIVIGAPAAKLSGLDPVAIEAVRELVAGGASRRAAVDVVARLCGVSRRALYDASLSASHLDRVLAADEVTRPSGRPKGKG